MKKKITIRPSLIIIIIILCSAIFFMLARLNYIQANDSLLPSRDNRDTSFYSTFKHAPENENCLKCHGQSKFYVPNKSTGKTSTKKMYSELIIPRYRFYVSNHREFKCTDCHSEDYMTFPHAGDLMMQAMPNCLDCHGGDPKYAKYHFENIEKEFNESVHVKRLGTNFTCWKCHNGHFYKITARSGENIKHTIAYDNAICLNCHADSLNYQLLTEKETPNLISKHDWLPNQKLHFTSVRCIECHTKKSAKDSTLVAHQILPKGEAVKKCQECHSTNSILLATLYRYEVKETRSTKGFIAGSIINDKYVIGANRNYYLNVLSIIIIIFVFIGITVHTFLRMIK